MGLGKHSVLLVDDHPVVSAGIKLWLADSDEFTVCGQAEALEEALKKAEELRPDLIVADLHLGRDTILNAIPDLFAIRPQARILIYSNQEEMAYARRALQAGAHGYMMKSSDMELLVEALRCLARGERWFSPAMQRAFLEILANGTTAKSPIDLLANRELEVFRRLGAGLSSAAIAAEMGVSVKTVGTYRENLKAKLGLRTARNLEQCAEAYLKTGKIA